MASNYTGAMPRATEELRIVMVGKTGVGKSASGNTILGRESFESVTSPESVTDECSKTKATVDGQDVAVIDTPGLYDTSKDEDTISRTISQCISYACPGPHVFLIVISLSRFTKEEMETVQQIQKLFGQAADRYSMVLFTRGDDLQGTTIEKFIGKSSHLQKLVGRCHGQYHVFNNKLKTGPQVTELLQKIRDIVKNNGGSHYTNEMFQEAQKAIEERQRILKEKEEEMHKEREQLKKERNAEFDEKFKNMEKMYQERERQERERQERERQERERQERERQERERQERERQEWRWEWWRKDERKQRDERWGWERLERERQEREHLERERQERESQERERQERERQEWRWEWWRKDERKRKEEERQRILQEKEEEMRKEREQLRKEIEKLKYMMEKERQERERQEKEREKRERQERERQERERQERERQEWRWEWWRKDERKQRDEHWGW